MQDRLPFSDLADGLMRNFIFKKVCKVMSHFYSMIINIVFMSKKCLNSKIWIHVYLERDVFFKFPHINSEVILSTYFWIIFLNNEYN